MRKYDQKRQFVQSKKITKGKVPKLRRLQFQTVYVSSNCLVSKSSPTLLQTQGLQPARLLYPWDFPGKNTGAGCHSFLQGIFLTQGSNSGLPHHSPWAGLSSLAICWGNLAPMHRPQFWLASFQFYRNHTAAPEHTVKVTHWSEFTFLVVPPRP